MESGAPMTTLLPSRHERGSTLLLTLFSMSVIAFLFLQVAAHAHSLFAITHSLQKGNLFRSSMREAMTTPRASQRTCERQQLSGQVISQSWHVCSHGFAPFASLPTIPLPAIPFNYDTVFATALPCPSAPQAISERSFHHPVSPYTCTVAGTQSDGLTLTDNIIAQDLTLSNLRPNETLRLASPGTITITGVLSLTGDTLILAGGDLRIATLRSESGVPSSITLLSAHGDVTLDEVIGPLSVVGIGRARLALPPTTPAAHYPLPGTRSVRISGIIQ